MIVPQVSAASYAAGDIEVLVETLKRWSLFGQVALVECQPWKVEDLERICQAVGGSVEFLIEFSADDSDTFLKFLNAGATEILSNSKKPEGLPATCWRNRFVDDENFQPSGKLVHLGQPTAQRTAQLIIDGGSCLIDANWLDQHPGIIADTFQLVLVSDRTDGLWPTVVVDRLGMALGLAYSNRESLRDAIEHRRGTYWSRSRGGLWVKGASSGAVQKLIGIRWDCDRDCLRFQVDQQPPGFCHRNTYACFGEERSIVSVIQRLEQRMKAEDPKSFTKKLANDSLMLEKKLLEEAAELAEAKGQADVAFEAADVFYFSLVKILSSNVKLEEVYQELFRRMTRIERRPNKLEN